MAVNELTYLFGPSIPPEIDSVGLAFISSPPLDPDTSVASLSAERYVRENFPNINEFEIVPSSSVGDYISVSYAFLGTTVGGKYSLFGEYSGGGRVDLLSSGWSLKTLHAPIKVRGIEIDKTGSWYPVVQPGVVWRKYVVHANEPASSWIIRSGLASGDTVYLIYSVPEYRYGSHTTLQTATFPGSGRASRSITEIASVISPNKIGYSGNISVLQTISVNNTTKSSTAFDGTGTHTYIRDLNRDLKTIDVKDNLLPDDEVRLTYDTYSDFYTYKGFRDYDNKWYSFDCNPEFGHVIVRPENYEGNSSSTVLQDQVTLYLIPSAYAIVNYEEDSSEGFLGDVNITFVSALDWGETHFVRHMVGQPAEEITTIEDGGASNTWGHAVLGENTYDQGLSASSDIFSSSLPSMMPLGKLVLAAPAAVDALAIADVRRRGGGVPEDFPMIAVNTQASGLDTLRGYYDLGVWEGKGVKEGGVVEFQFDTSVLDEYTESEIEEMVQLVLPPGIDYEIIYRTIE